MCLSLVAMHSDGPVFRLEPYSLHQGRAVAALAGIEVVPEKQTKAVATCSCKVSEVAQKEILAS